MRRARTRTPRAPTAGWPCTRRTPTSPAAAASCAVLPEPVADAADRLERRAPERPVDLLAEVAHVDLDDVPVALEREVPCVLHELAARHHLPGPPHEQLQQRELLGG